MFSRRFALGIVLVFFGILSLQTDMGQDRVFKLMSDENVKEEGQASSKKRRW